MLGTVELQPNTLTDAIDGGDETAEILSMLQHVPVNCRAQVADRSTSGISLITDVRIPRDVLLKVVLDSAIVFGEVRYCSPRVGHPESFTIGVQIETVIPRKESSSNCLYPVAVKS